jgi:DNA-binding transcriptional ArsR family regulator
MDAFTLAAVGHAVGDPTRVQVLSMANGKLSVTEIGNLLGVSKATASHHVRVLEEVGLVEIVRGGRCHRPKRRLEGVWELARDVGRLSQR